MPPAHPTRAAVQSRFRDILRAALHVAEDIAAAQFAPVPVRLETIGPTALAAFSDQWAGHPRRRYPWPWIAIAEDYRRKEPDRFEVAAWSGTSLCGLAIGGTRREFCRVDYLEGSPDVDHPLKGKVTVTVSGAVLAYAKALNKNELRLMSPIPEMVPYYEALGFALASAGGDAPYCGRKLT